MLQYRMAGNSKKTNRSFILGLMSESYLKMNKEHLSFKRPGLRIYKIDLL
jgi:hypothetical protein